MNNFTTLQELSRTLENIQGQQNILRIKDKTSFDANSRRDLGVQGRLAALAAHFTAAYMSGSASVASIDWLDAMH